MTALISATIGRLRFNHAPLAREQHPEVERAGAVSALVRATVRRLGLGQRPLLFEQKTEVRGGSTMTALVGATVCACASTTPPWPANC